MSTYLEYLKEMRSELLEKHSKEPKPILAFPNVAFERALLGLKDGFLARRAVWNGESFFLRLAPNATNKLEFVKYGQPQVSDPCFYSSDILANDWELWGYKEVQP